MAVTLTAYYAKHKKRTRPKERLLGSRAIPVIPDNILPAQFLFTHPGWTPEQLLCAAVLEDAVKMLLVPETRHTRGQQKLDLAWVLSSEQNYAFDFLNICDALDLDADWIRAGVLKKRRAA